MADPKPSANKHTAELGRAVSTSSHTVAEPDLEKKDAQTPPGSGYLTGAKVESQYPVTTVADGSCFPSWLWHSRRSCHIPIKQQAENDRYCIVECFFQFVSRSRLFQFPSD